eukprot:gb/GECG01005662.1/.p1 GENE.gb/GECG01005662.1/~~gb/GECG01005662.1/.p1  ORF type:complete len:106 (+),score=12.82 gb/GECG01005662.1/:1-318(+)
MASTKQENQLTASLLDSGAEAQPTASATAAPSGGHGLAAFSPGPGNKRFTEAKVIEVDGVWADKLEERLNHEASLGWHVIAESPVWKFMFLCCFPRKVVHVTLGR